MPSLSIRRVRPGDAERVRELHRVAIREAGTPPSKLPDTSDLDDLRGYYVESGGEFLVGEYGGGKDDGTEEKEDDAEIVAMGGIRPIDDATAEIKRMRVHPDYQGRGFGRAILDALEATARENGFERIVVETAERQDSAGFYRTHGYLETGRREWDEFELIELAKEP